MHIQELITFFIFQQALRVSSFNITDENNLYTALFSSSYNSIVRPAETVDVKVKFHLLTINDVNTKQQIITVAGFFTVEWNDGRLVWTPSSYAGIISIYQLETQVWRPEVIIDNSVTNLEPLYSSSYQNKLRITNTGDIKWETAGIYDVHCDIDTTFYPFDTQKCFLEMTSWTYSIQEVSLTHTVSEISLEDYRPNGEWRVISTNTGTSQLHDDGEIRSQLEFYINIERRAAFYVLNVIVPVIICSTLIPVVFLLPVESGEKVSYVLTLLLAIAVVLTIIADKLPTSSKTVSVFAIYLAINLCFGGFSILVSVAVLHFYHHNESEEIPNWLRNATTRLFMKFPKHKKLKAIEKKTNCKPQVVPEEEMVEITPKDAMIESDCDSNLEWKDVSESLDAFSFRVFSISLIVLCIVFMVALAIGAEIATQI